jgi:hypothetical protein
MAMVRESYGGGFKSSELQETDVQRAAIRGYAALARGEIVARF